MKPINQTSRDKIAASMVFSALAAVFGLAMSGSDSTAAKLGGGPVQIEDARAKHFAEAADAAARSGAVAVIARLTKPVPADLAGDGANQGNLEAQGNIVELAKAAGKVESVKTYQILPIVAMTVDIAALRALENNPEVEDIELDTLSAPQ